MIPNFKFHPCLYFKPKTISPIFAYQSSTTKFCFFKYFAFPLEEQNSVFQLYYMAVQYINIGEVWNPVCCHGRRTVKPVLWSTFSRIFLHRGGHKGGPKTTKPYRNTPKNRKPHRIFSQVPKPYMYTGRPTIWKLTSPRLGVSFAAFANIFISAGTEIINIRAKLNPSSGKGTSMTCSPRETQKERKLTSSS